MITKEEILDSIGERRIYEYYLGYQFKLGELYQSPFRKDSQPSFNIFVHSRKGTLYFKDLGRSDLHGDVFQFVQFIKNCTFKEAVEQIAEDLNGFLGSTVKPPKEVYTPKEFKDIEVVIRKFKIYDKFYWEQYNISSAQLKKFNIVPIQEVYVNGSLIWIGNNLNPIYGYSINGRWRLYRPLETNKRYKWLSNLTPIDIQGYNQLPKKGEICLITSSLKDIVCLDLFSLPGIAPSSENSALPIKLIESLKRRFDKVVVYFNNDEPGIKAAESYWQMYGLTNIYNPYGTPKDPSDYIKKYGKSETETMIYSLLDGESYFPPDFDDIDLPF